MRAPEVDERDQSVLASWAPQFHAALEAWRATFPKPTTDDAVALRAVWHAAGSPVPMPRELKADEVRRYVERSGIRRVVETGSHWGHTIDWVRHHADEVISVELDPELAGFCRERFAGDLRVQLHEGDSVEVLDALLESSSAAAVFWLDAHYSGDGTARGELDTPIRAELELILRHGHPGDVVLIDDARLFGAGDYPAISEVEALVATWRRDWVFEVRDDIVRAHAPFATKAPEQAEDESARPNGGFAAEGRPGRPRNVYLQYGEDGAIEDLLSVIGTGDRPFAIEFGAADGFFCSNTARLWNDQGWDALLIEAAEDRYEALSQHRSDRVSTLCARVENLDDLTTRVADVCSIDVDGDDYHIFERMQVRHRIVCIEHNPTVPPHVEMVGQPGTRQGASALSLVRLAARKGYRLAAATGCNLVFVRDEDASGLEVELDDVFDRQFLSYVVTDYDGRFDVVGRLPYGMDQRADLGLRHGAS